MHCLDRFGFSHLEAIERGVVDSVSSGITKAVHFFAHVHQDWQETKKNWHERVVAQLDSYDCFLDQKIPNSSIQDRLDTIGREIEEAFAPLTEFNRWLDSNGHGSWSRQLATFLVKLPFRAVRNIVRLLYDIVKTAMYTVVHPLKSLNHLVKLIATLVYELTKPEVWTKTGAGLIGASAGQAAVTGNPFSVIGLGIGAGLILGGISIGALEASLEAEDGRRGDAALHNFCEQIKAIPEAALTGFCMGLLMGAVSKQIGSTRAESQTVSSYAKRSPISIYELDGSTTVVEMQIGKEIYTQIHHH